MYRTRRKTLSLIHVRFVRKVLVTLRCLAGHAYARRNEQLPVCWLVPSEARLHESREGRAKEWRRPAATSADRPAVGRHMFDTARKSATMPSERTECRRTGFKVQIDRRRRDGRGSPGSRGRHGRHPATWSFVRRQESTLASKDRQHARESQD